MIGKIPVTCPHCHSAGQIPTAYAGHTIHCKKCDTHFPVPASHPASPIFKETPRTEAAHAASRAPLGAATAQATVHTPRGKSFLDSLSESSELAPLTAEDEKHARERYEARVLSKDRSAHYDENGNLISEEELARKNLQKQAHDL
ncbi:MAG: hypothetical protein U0835_07455 [Isosphaeraceae bacterium]